LYRVRRAGLSWPLAPELMDEVLEQKLFQRPGIKAGLRQHTEPDWGSLVREMKRPGVNLTVLWEEYRERHPEGYSYSRYVAAKFMLCERLVSVRASRPGRS